jgi:hypothetical protein
MNLITASLKYFFNLKNGYKAVHIRQGEKGVGRLIFEIIHWREGVVHRSIESPVCAIVAFPPGSLFVYTDRTDTCIQGRFYRILEEVPVV